MDNRFAIYSGMLRSWGSGGGHPAPESAARPNNTFPPTSLHPRLRHPDKWVLGHGAQMREIAKRQALAFRRRCFDSVRNCTDHVSNN